MDSTVHAMKVFLLFIKRNREKVERSRNPNMPKSKTEGMSTSW